MSSKICKFCQKSGLTWNYNGPIKKWELLEPDGNKHRCLILRKPQASVSHTPKINIKNDPKINKALRIFAKHLEKEKGTNRRNYILGPARDYKKR